MDEQSFKWSHIPVQFLAGLVFVLFNVPGFVRYTARHWIKIGFVSGTLEWLADIPENIYAVLGPADSDLFATLFKFSIYGIGLYLLGIIVLALNKGELRLVPGAVIGLLAGICAVAITLWALVVLLWLGQALVALVILLLPYLKILLYVIGGIVALLVVGSILMALWEEFGIWTIIILPVGLLILVGLAWLAWSYAWLILKIILWIAVIGFVIGILAWIWEEYSAPGVVIALILAAVGWLARSWIWLNLMLPIFAFLIKAILWLANIAGIVFGFLFRALVFIVLVLMGVGIIASLGNLFLDEFRAAWKGGSGMRGTLLASYGIGMAVALILLASSGSPETMDLVDRAWNETVPVLSSFSPMSAFLGMMPKACQGPLQAAFATAGIPIFDVVALSAVLGFSYLGIVRGFGREHEDEFHVSFIGKEAALLAIGAPLALLVVIGMVMLPAEE